MKTPLTDWLTDWLYLNILLSSLKPFVVVWSHERVDKARDEVTDSLRAVSPQQFSPSFCICSEADLALLLYLKKSIPYCHFALLARPYLNIKTQMSLYQRSKFLTKHGQHLSPLPPNPSLARHLLAAAS